MARTTTETVVVCAEDERERHRIFWFAHDGHDKTLLSPQNNLHRVKLSPQTTDCATQRKSVPALSTDKHENAGDVQADVPFDLSQGHP